MSLTITGRSKKTEAALWQMQKSILPLVKSDRGEERKRPDEPERAGHMRRETGPYYCANTEGCARVGYICDALPGLLPMPAP